MPSIHNIQYKYYCLHAKRIRRYMVFHRTVCNTGSFIEAYAIRDGRQMTQQKCIFNGKRNAKFLFEAISVICKNSTVKDVQIQSKNKKREKEKFIDAFYIFSYIHVHTYLWNCRVYLIVMQFYSIVVYLSIFIKTELSVIVALPRLSLLYFLFNFGSYSHRWD